MSELRFLLCADGITAEEKYTLKKPYPKANGLSQGAKNRSG